MDILLKQKSRRMDRGASRNLKIALEVAEHLCSTTLSMGGMEDVPYALSHDAPDTVAGPALWWFPPYPTEPEAYPVNESQMSYPSALTFHFLPQTNRK
jgi:hypothetical protein